MTFDAQLPELLALVQKEQSYEHSHISASCFQVRSSCNTHESDPLGFFNDIMNSRKRKGSPCQFDEFVYEKEATRTFRAVNDEKPATDDSFFNDDMILKVRREVYSWMLKVSQSIVTIYIVSF